jgi:hypothetical protein
MIDEKIFTMPVSVAEVRGYLGALLEDKDEIKKQPDIISFLMIKCMRHFKGGMSPVKLRPLITVELYGIEATRVVLEDIRREMFKLCDFCVDNKELNERLDEVEETVQALIKYWEGESNFISQHFSRKNEDKIKSRKIVSKAFKSVDSDDNDH